MKKPTLLERFIDLATFWRYNCRRERHRWGYLLSEVGMVFLDDSKVPTDAWHCLDCGVKKYDETYKKFERVYMDEQFLHDYPPIKTTS